MLFKKKKKNTSRLETVVRLKQIVTGCKIVIFTRQIQIFAILSRDAASSSAHWRRDESECTPGGV